MLHWVEQIKVHAVIVYGSVSISKLAIIALLDKGHFHSDYKSLQVFVTITEIPQG